uniref:Uncharacterized protein n=1 Tax=Arundo donax TaxID=35708 RepID=A0A0A9GW29_ARUDO
MAPRWPRSFALDHCSRRRTRRRRHAPWHGSCRWRCYPRRAVWGNRRGRGTARRRRRAPRRPSRRGCRSCSTR